MQFQFDIWLLVLSIIAGTIASFFVVGFIERINHASAGLKKILLITFGLAAGTGLWANHILISTALHEGVHTNHSASMLFGAWVISILVGTLILYEASKHHFSISSLMVSSTTASIGVLGVFYFNLRFMYGPSEFQFDSFYTICSLIFGVCILAAIMTMFYWVKSYAADNRTLAKVLTGFLVSLCAISIHFAYKNAISFNIGMQNDASISAINKLTGIIVALAFLSFFLLVFIITLFFEKHGKQLFKFSLFGLSKISHHEAQSMTDSLTKLPNLRAFQQHLASVEKRCERTGNAFALAYIDLDHFKPINDQYGHHAGDIVLKEVAARLNEAVRGCDFVARIGGDEFVAVIEEMKSDEDVTPIVERMLSAVKEKYQIQQFVVELSCSIGIAIYPKDGDVQKLIMSADAAMYKAKENGKNQFRFYDAEIEAASDQLLEMQRDLCLALENKELSLALQPKFDCKTQALVGAEALVRWNHPTKGVILPKVFLPAAERFGLINEINDWVVEECCRVIAHFKTAGIHLNIAVNLANQQFRNPNLVEDISKLINIYDIEPRRLTFEIKETAAIKNQSQFKLLLSMFNEAGIKVALDDFGLHPISLAYLQELSIDELKLDRSFVADITENKSTKPLIQAVIQLAHALSLNVVAEGVETEVQKEVLIALGCNHMQGYYLSEPISDVELFELSQQLQQKQLQIDFEYDNKPTSKVIQLAFA